MAFHLSLQNKPNTLDKQLVRYKDLGLIDYKAAWDYQESLLQENVQRKSALAKVQATGSAGTDNESVQSELPQQQVVCEDTNHSLASVVPHDRNQERQFEMSPNETKTYGELNNGNSPRSTVHYFLLCEHPPVYTLGKSGHVKNILISESEMEKKGIQFFKTNRGGDITFHGPGQIVGYPIIDLEKFYTDIGRYLRELEEVIILTLAEYGIHGKRSKGETGVWIDPDVPGKERKICAMGVRCSRWITMHGFALNVNTSLSFFDYIIPCGIENKKVTSMAKELNGEVDFDAVKDKIQHNFEKVFKIAYCP